MKITRRNFIRTTGTAVFAAGLLGSAGNVFGQSRAAGDIFAVPSESLSDPLLYLTRAHFEPYLNTTIQVRDGEKEIQLTLVELPAHDLQPNQKRGFYGESFSLILAAPGRTRIEPGLYTIEHPVLGTFLLNLNPVGRSNRCEAVINRVNR
jgi:hypothetical protein